MILELIWLKVEEQAEIYSKKKDQKKEKEVWQRRKEAIIWLHKKGLKLRSCGDGKAKEMKATNMTFTQFNNYCFSSYLSHLFDFF